MMETAALIITAFGVLFMGLAALGIFRMPDLFIRMSTTTKAATVGAGLVLAGAALYFRDLTITTRAVAVIIFLFMTAPVAAHMLGRAAYFEGIPLWKGTRIDEWHGRKEDNTASEISTSVQKASDDAMSEE